MREKPFAVHICHTITSIAQTKLCVQIYCTFKEKQVMPSFHSTRDNFWQTLNKICGFAGVF